MDEDGPTGSRHLDQAVGLLRRYATSNEPSHLDEAVGLLETATGLMPDGRRPRRHHRDSRG